jgi:hypothetical protein
MGHKNAHIHSEVSEFTVWIPFLRLISTVYSHHTHTHPLYTPSKSSPQSNYSSFWAGSRIIFWVNPSVEGSKFRVGFADGPWGTLQSLLSYPEQDLQRQTRSATHRFMMAERSAGHWSPRTPEMYISHLIERFKNRESHCILYCSLASLPSQSGPWQHLLWYKSHSISLTVGLWGSFWNTRMLMHQVLFQAVSYLLGFGDLSLKSR